MYKTNMIPIYYETIYQFKLCNHIQFTVDLKRVFNYQKEKEITTSNNFKKGFWYDKKFYRLDKIKDMIELIPKYKIKDDDPLINIYKH